MGQLLLLLMPYISNCTSEVLSSICVEPASTMVFSLLDTELIVELTTGSSRTPGEHPGENLDTSELRETILRMERVSAVFKCNHLTQLSDYLLNISLHHLCKVNH